MIDSAQYVSKELRQGLFQTTRQVSAISMKHKTLVSFFIILDFLAVSVTRAGQNIQNQVPSHEAQGRKNSPQVAEKALWFSFLSVTYRVPPVNQNVLVIRPNTARQCVIG
jgi:hypothetical protein